MADLTPQLTSVEGVALTFASASSGGDTMANSQKRTLLVIKNTHATDPRTVTVSAQTLTRPRSGAYPEQDVPNQSKVVAAGEVTCFGPFPSSYNNADGQIEIGYSNSGADVKVAGLRITI